MLLKSIQGILFLSYFTEYNIGEMFYALENFLTLDDYVGSTEFRISNETNGRASILPKVETSIVDANTAYERNKYNKIYHLPYFSEKYPVPLRTINQPPPMLYVKGKFVSNKSAAIIGTRKVSALAEVKTRNVVDKFLAMNYTIVSGLALGIDTFAHKAALDKGGYTIAVMPNSLDTVYPKENYWLANKILDADGALISELPTGMNRGKKSFVERNRIQSGLSEFVVPIEMATSSGTMHTVNFCKAQKRKLLLINPTSGEENSPYNEGVTHLIEIQNKKSNENVFVLNDDFNLSAFVKEDDANSAQLSLF